MKRIRSATAGHFLALALAFALPATSLPARAALTRDEVRAALADARASGALIAPGDSGLSLREQRPDLFPSAPARPARTRADVVAELRQARRAGELMHGDSGRSDAELAPGAYSVPVAPRGRTRAEVRAELAEAQRTGDVLAAGDSGLTLREQHPGRYAGSVPNPVLASRPAGASQPPC
jgi:hypothetical protein